MIYRATRAPVGLDGLQLQSRPPALYRAAVGLVCAGKELNP